MNVEHVVPAPGLALNYPKSLAVFDDYAAAQRVVDFLADRGFAVANLAIVGTDLRTIERVTGRITRAKVAAAGAMSGLWIGLFVGVAFTLFTTGGQAGALLLMPLLGALFGLVFSQLGFTALTRGGTRDFASISQVVATRYELLVEHGHAEAARALVEEMPPAG